MPKFFTAAEFRLVRTLADIITTLGGALAEDVAADTWVSVVKGLDRFEGDEDGWRAWVLTIGRARLRDAQRRAARGPTGHRDVQGCAGVPHAPDPAAKRACSARAMHRSCQVLALSAGVRSR